MTLINRTKSTTIGAHISAADTSLKRFVGLIGRRRLDAGEGILITPSSGIHTFGMMFSIDVIGLDREMRVVKIWPRLAPFRLTSISFAVHSVLELAAGEISACQVSVGDQLAIL